MYQNQTSRDHTPAELAALKTLLAPDPATKLPTGQYAGMTPAQIAAALSAQRSTPNPAPQGFTLPATIPKATVLGLLYVIKDELSQAVNVGDPAANPPVGPDSTKQGVLTYVTGVVSDVQNYDEPLDLNYVASQYLAKLVGFGLVTQAAFDAAVQVPDPNYLVNILAGPLAFRALGADVLPEAADITAALES